MSYGNQLNIFRAKAQEYGRDWCAIVCCSDAHEMKLAEEDAEQLLGGKCTRIGHTMTLPNGASMLFRIVTFTLEADRAFRGREFTQIAWLHRPTDQYIIDLARSRLRSRTVPADDWRYEYCLVR